MKVEVIVRGPAKSRKSQIIGSIKDALRDDVRGGFLPRDLEVSYREETTRKRSSR